MNFSADISQKKILPGVVIALAFLVFVIIGIGLCEPLTKPRTMALKASAFHDEKLILAAIDAYHTVYGKYPVQPDTQGVVVFSKDNYRLFDVLRNRTGMVPGNTLNPQGLAILQVPLSGDEKNPKSGIQVSTGIWYDPWGSPYHVAINTNKKGGFDKADLPDFYSDPGSLYGVNVIVWSYGPNGRLGGGQALKLGFIDEAGAPGKLSDSDDVVSWK